MLISRRHSEASPHAQQTRCYRVCAWALPLLLAFGAVHAEAGLIRGLKVNVDGQQRSYDLYVPQHKSGQALPLVLMYHGHLGNSDVMTGANGKKAPYKLWLALAEREQFLVAAPNGEKGADNKQGWNDCRADTTTNPETDDVKFTLQMIEAIHARTPVDRSRIYATGTSNGGNMVIRLAMEVPQTFAAVAAVVASNPVKSECTETRKPIPVLFMNGTDDPLLPYQGGAVGKDKHGRGTALSTPLSVDYWRAINGLPDTPTVYNFPDRYKRDKSTVTRLTYCAPKHFPVVLYRVERGGHTEPSLQEHYRRLYKRIVGPQNRDIEMADEVWQFFKDKRR